MKNAALAIIATLMASNLYVLMQEAYYPNVIFGRLIMLSALLFIINKQN